MLAIVWLVASRWAYEGIAATDSDRSDSPSRRPGKLLRFDPLQLIELNLYDWRVNLAARHGKSVSPQLGLVAIQDSTIERLRRKFPLGESYGLLMDRSLYGRVLRELTAQEARAVAFDIVLAEERPDHREIVLAGGEKISSDAFFASQLRASERAILACPIGSPPAARFRGSGPQLGAVDRTVDTDGVTRRVPAFVVHQFVSQPLLAYANRRGLEVKPTDASRLQFVDHLQLETNFVPVTASGKIRVGTGDSVTNFARGALELPALTPPRVVWNMGILLAAAQLGLDMDQARVEPGLIHLPGTNLVSLTLPVDRSTNLLIAWSTSIHQVPKIDFEDLLFSDRVRQSNEVSDLPSVWKDKLMLVGSTASGNNLTDVGATPMSNKDNLVGIYLNVANAVIQNRFVTRLPLWCEILIVIGLAATGSFLTWRLRTTLAVGLIALIGVAFVGITVWLYDRSQLWLPLAHPLLAGLLLNHATTLAYRAMFEQRERQRVRSVFAKIVSPNIVQELLRAEHLGLGGARRRVTVFFADVRGFTEMTDHVQVQAEQYVRTNSLTGAAAEAYFDAQSAELLTMVNRYLATIADVIKAHGGTLDKYIGDCVMAFWGAPAANPHHAVEGVLAAIDAQRAIFRLNAERQTENETRETENVSRVTRGEAPLPLLPLLALGTGINTGTVNVGLMGSDAHIVNYTVFGREVNLASRLEGVSGRSRIIIGEGTYRELQQQKPDLARLCRSLEPVTVKGFRQPVPAYEVEWREAEQTALLVRPPDETAPSA